MKRKINISILLLAFSVFLSNVRVGLYFAYYLADKQGFVELFCKNKNQPELHCEGKCKLSEITSESKKEVDFDFNKLKTNFIWIIQYSSQFSFLGEKNLLIHIFYYKRIYYNPFYSSIFHPPILR